MPIEHVVANASPLICLFRADLQDLLGELWDSVAVRGGVWNEILDGPNTDRAIQLLENASWIRRVEVDRVHQSIAGWDLGLGESEVLTFALLNHGFSAIIDDAEARRCSRTLGIPILGTGGVLILAKRRGLIPYVSEALNSLSRSGLWLSEHIIEILKRMAGE